MTVTHAVEKFWYSRSWLTLLVWPLQLPLLLLVLLKRLAYRYNLLASNRFNKPVLVVGNLSVGGTGKTPFIASLVKHFSQQGVSVGIVSRGYKSTVSSFPHQVSDQDNATTVGDEAFMQYKNLKVPIVISPARSNAVDYLLKNNQVDLIISDDGLQHYQMGRAIEVVLFDGARQFGNKMILPFGPLREPLGRLKSVDFVIQNGNQPTEFTHDKSTLVETALVNLKSGESKPLEFLASQEVVAVAGIGNPQRFFDSLSKFAKINSTSVFPDHHKFSLADFNHIHEDKVVVMTEKDAVKCTTFAKKNWYYLSVSMDIPTSLLQRINKKILDVTPK